MPLDFWRQDQCLTCYLCQTACPVMANEPTFLGPKVLGPELARFGQGTGKRPGTKDSLDLCTGCGLCRLACPAGVNLPDLILAARGAFLQPDGVVQNGRSRFALRDRSHGFWKRFWTETLRPIGQLLLDRRARRRWLLARPELLGRVLGRWPRLQHLFWPQPMRQFLRIVFGLAPDVPLPSYPETKKGREEKATTGSAASVGAKKAAGGKLEKAAANGALSLRGRRVAYFTGCSARYNDPDLLKDVVTLLEGFGAEVVIPPQTCCGTPAMHNGDLVEASRKASYNLRHFLPLVWEGYDIVTACPSCGLAWKKEYRELLGLAEAEEIVEHVYDFSEYLALHRPEPGAGGETRRLPDDGGSERPAGVRPPGADLRETEKLNPARAALEEAIRPLPVDPGGGGPAVPGGDEGALAATPVPAGATVLYHTACHLRAQAIGTPSVELLESMAGLRVKKLPAYCCGMSGTYGFKVERAELAKEIGEELFQSIRAAGEKIVVTECASCALQIRANTGATVIHPAKILARQKTP